jgi:hypothetical protein
MFSRKKDLVQSKSLREVNLVACSIPFPSKKGRMRVDLVRLPDHSPFGTVVE